MDLKHKMLHKDLTILNYNANGLKRQSFELQCLLHSKDIDIACITETHLKPSVKMKIRNYVVYRNDREQRYGGGTAIIIKTTIPHRLAPTPTFNVLEATTVYVYFNNVETLIASAYYPPYGTIDVQDLTTLTSLHQNFIICGDFNAKHRTWNSRINTPKGDFLLEHATKWQYAIFGPEEPTRYPWIVSQHPDVLDICLYRGKNITVRQQSLIALDSDHVPVLLTFQRSLLRHPKPHPHINTIDWNNYTKSLHQSIPGNPQLNQTSDIDAAIQMFTNTLTATLHDVTTAVNTKRINQEQNELHYIVRAKNQARRRWQQYGDIKAKRAYYRYQRAIRRKCQQNTIQNFANKAQELTSGGKEFWTFTNQVLGKSIRPVPSPLQNQYGHLTYNQQEKSEILAESFRKRFRPHHHLSDLTFTENTSRQVLDVLCQPPHGTIPHINPKEVRAIIKTLPTNKSPGPDHITPMALKHLPVRAITHLTKIYNTCLRFHYFPTNWKTAYITAIPKLGKDKTSPVNYRPISLLDFLGKILERLILNRLKILLDSPERIQHAQFGFKRQHSTREALIRLTEHIQQSFQRRFHTVAIFLDVEQAFDTVWHHGLLYKLQQLRIPDAYIHLLASYLQQRTFRIKSGTSFSSMQPISAGVPQGSVLAPTLYSVYTQDLPLLPHCQYSLYADDTVIYTSHFNFQEACTRMQRALDLLTQWSTKWRIKINGSKSQFLVFTKRFPHITSHLHIQGKLIPYSTTVKYLGITLDSRLTFRQHIENVRTKAFQRYMALYSLFKSPASRSVKTLIYISYIRSFMTYCCEIWASAHPRHLQRLNGIQRAICRTISGAHYLINNTQLYSDLQLPMFSDHVKHLQATFKESLRHHPNPLLHDLTT